MTIDDIHYLYRNSIKNNVVLLIDSSRRNKFHYRTPSEFVVEFPEPFRNVIGCEVLNAAIPRTTFTVDKHNGRLRTWMYTYTLDDVNTMEIKNEFHDVELRPTDFTQADSLLSDIVSAFRNIDQTFNVVPDSAAFDSDATIAESGYLKFSSRRSPFIIDASLLNSPMAPILGFSLHASNQDDGYVIKDDLFSRDLRMFTMPSAQTIINEEKCLADSFSIKVDRSNPNGNGRVIILDQATGVLSYVLSLDEHNIVKKINCGILIKSVSINNTTLDISNLGSQFVKDSIYIKNIGSLSDDVTIVEIKVEFVYTMDNSKKLYTIPKHEFFCSTTNDTNGDQDNPIQLTSDEYTDESTVRFVNSSNYEAINLHKFKFKISQIPNLDEGVVYIMLESTHSTNDQNLVIECIYSSSNGQYYLTYDISWDNTAERLNLSPFNFIRILDANYALYLVKSTNMVDVRNNRIDILEVLANDYDENIIYNSVMYNTTFEMVPPGIINMVTENYVTLRCPEIENHSRGAMDANDVSPGLALFTIDVRSGYAANKNEFFSVKYKEFHPIGKLSRLHFRFERKSDGKLYDFKGVDLHFILSLKVLSPSKLNFKDAKDMEYPLNPNYNPDYQGFMQNEFNNVESDEEIESRQIDETAFAEERRLQNMHRRHNARFKQVDSSDEEYGYDERQYDSEYTTGGPETKDIGSSASDDGSTSSGSSEYSSDDGSESDSDSDTEDSDDQREDSDDSSNDVNKPITMNNAANKIYNTVFGPTSLIQNTVAGVSSRGNQLINDVQNVPQQLASGNAIATLSKRSNRLIRNNVPDYVADVSSDAVTKLSSSVKERRDDLADELAEMGELKLSEVPGYITQQALLSQQASKKKLKKAYQNLPKTPKKKFDNTVAEAALKPVPWDRNIQLTYADGDAGPNEMGMQPARRRRGEFQG